MNRARARGQAAESWVAQYLQRQGLTFLERNFLCKCGEIDLVMQEGDCRVLVEVRFRSSLSFGGPVYSLDRQKCKRFVLASRVYLQVRNYTGMVRLDVVGLLPGVDGYDVQWIKNAVEAI